MGPYTVPWALLYASLSACSLLVALIPGLFGPIAEHGKTAQRSSPTSKKDRGSSDGNRRRSREGHNNEITGPASLAVWSRLMTGLHEHAKVPKSMFSTMYLFAVLCCLVPLGSTLVWRDQALSDTNAGGGGGLGLGTAMCLLNARPHLVLLVIHCSRRLVESSCMTIFGASTMHLSGVAVGLLHYAAAVVLFSEMETRLEDVPLLQSAFALLLFIVGNIMQHHLHLILYRIKQDQRLAYRAEAFARERDKKRLLGAVVSSGNQTGKDQRSHRDGRGRRHKVSNVDSKAEDFADETTSALSPEAMSPGSVGSSPSSSIEGDASRSRTSSSNSLSKRSRDSSPMSEVSVHSTASSQSSPSRSGKTKTVSKEGREHAGFVTPVKGASVRSSPPPSPALYKYEVPRGSWFRWLCCPHYLAEIIIYVSFLLLAPTSSALQGLLLWVVSNLAVTGRRQLQWYKADPRLRRQIPPNWSVLIPGIF